MKKLLLMFVLFSSFAFADYGDSTKYPDTNCTLANRTLIVDGVVQPQTYSASHTAENEARKLSQKLGKQVFVRTPDMSCVTVWRANPALPSSSSSSSSSARSSSASSVSISSVSSSSSTACPPTAINPFYRIGGTVWNPGGTITAPARAVIELGPQPFAGSWLWSGCGGSGSTVREQTVITSTSCKITATYTNSCGAKSSYEYSIIISANSSSSASSNSSRSSSAASSTAAQTVTVKWSRPTQRENGAVLTQEEIGGYEIRQAVGSTFKTDRISAQATEKQITYNGGKIEIAVYDTTGLYSRFVEVK